VLHYFPWPKRALARFSSQQMSSALHNHLCITVSKCANQEYGFSFVFLANLLPQLKPDIYRNMQAVLDARKLQMIWAWPVSSIYSPPNDVYGLFRANAAEPKSINRMRPVSALMSMFSSLMSRWKTPASWTSFKIVMVCRRISRACGHR